MTLFSNYFSPEKVVRVWDVVFVDKLDALLKIALAILKINEAKCL
jgi:hypothetical protein